MKTNKLLKGSTSKTKALKVRFSVAVYFTALMTLLAPIYPAYAPVFRLSKAQAETPDYKSYARTASKLEYQWNEQMFECLDSIWTKESHWNPKADNPKSTAYGIAQMLNEDSRNGFEQISNGLRYIEHRYTNPCDAWEFWRRNNWY